MVTSKTVKSQFGNIELDIPGNVKSEYDPKVIPKHTKNITSLAEKIISRYSRVMSNSEVFRISITKFFKPISYCTSTYTKLFTY